MSRLVPLVFLVVSLLVGSAAAGAQSFDATTREIIVDATSDASFARIDLATGKVLDPADSLSTWQLSIRRYTVRLRNGVVATTAVDNTVEAVAAPGIMTASGTLSRFEAATAEDIPAMERFTAAFPSSVSPEDSPPFLYGVDPGNPHAVLPSFNIYMLKDGDTVYKVQFLSYYHPASGEARVITMRVAPVD